MEIHQPGAFEGDAGLGDQALQQGQITGRVAAGLTANRQRTRYPGLGHQGHDHPAAVLVGLGPQAGGPKQVADPVGKQLGLLERHQLEQRAAVGPAGRPGVGVVVGLAVTVKEGHGDLGGRERLADVPDEGVHHRGPAQGAGELLAEVGDAAQQGQVGTGVR